MIIKGFSCLDEGAAADIRELEAACKKSDGFNGRISLDTGLNFSKDMESVFLLYENGMLVSALSMFAPTRQEAEISAYTHPGYRKRGYFKELYNRALCEIKKHGIEDILLVCEAQSVTGKALAGKLNADYCFTEHTMRYSDSGQLSAYLSSSSILKVLGQENADILIEMSRSIFGDSLEDAKSIVMNILDSKNRVQYGLLHEDRLVGMGSACFQEDEVSIHGLGVLPEYQGRGFGKELLMLILKDLINKGYENITLEVDSINDKALKLYKNNGFQAETSYDYYRIKSDR